MKRFLKGVWQFCSYIFIPQWNKTEIWTYGEIRKSINPLVRESGYFFK